METTREVRSGEGWFGLGLALGFGRKLFPQLFFRRFIESFQSQVKSIFVEQVETFRSKNSCTTQTSSQQNFSLFTCWCEYWRIQKKRSNIKLTDFQIHSFFTTKFVQLCGKFRKKFSPLANNFHIPIHCTMGLDFKHSFMVVVPIKIESALQSECAANLIYLILRQTSWKEKPRKVKRKNYLNFSPGRRERDFLSVAY